MKNRSFKNQIFTTFLMFFVIFGCFKTSAGNEGLSVGETVPNPEIMPLSKYELDQMPRPVRIHDYKQDQNMLIAFMPDISDKNTYAKVMTTAFDTYFAEGLAFINGYDYSVSPGELRVLVVTNNNESEVKEYLEKLDLDFDMVSDRNLDIAHFFGVEKWTSVNEGSLVYIVNKDNKIVYSSYDYKGEGEKLKTVQKELFALYNIQENTYSGEFEYSALMTGDKARDFEFEYIYTGIPTAGMKTTETAKLSDYIGHKNVLIAFYPAPFSYSCGMEVTKFDSYAEDKMIQSVVNSGIADNNDLEILMISSSNPQILSKWRTEMSLNNVVLASDNTGEISAKYNSFSAFGYNKRTVFLVDKQGKISYIDWDYQVNDEDFNSVKQQISSLD